MQNTTSPAVPVLEAIPFNLLTRVSGGCGGHRRCCCPQPVPQQAQLQQTQIIQLPTVLAAPPTPPAPQPSNDIVSTNVSINGQVQARA
jgi:hypothetical protein